MKYRRMLFLAPAVAATLLGLACSQAEVHPTQLGDCLDPVKCNPPAAGGDGSTSKDGAVQDAKPASDAASDAAVDSGSASDAAKDAASDVDAS
ncbi:MAG TPA: hypothetical protein VF316_01550 [Polyangiaceae bacterium]